MKSFFYFLGLGLLFFYACGSDGPKEPILPPLGVPVCATDTTYFPNKIRYAHAEAPFALQIPEAWYKVEDPNGIYGLVLSDTVSVDDGRGVLSLTLAEGEDKRFKTYFDKSLKEFLALGDYELIRTGEAQIGGHQALAFFGYSKKTQEQMGYYRNVFYIIPVSGTIYLHLSLEAYGGPDKFEKVLCKLHEIIQTLEINN